jgi:hypothetical protein
MSYTITEPSNNYLPSDNISWFQSDSTDKDETSFVYRYRLQITGAGTAFTSGTTGADVVGTYRVPPRPVSGVGLFSPMTIAKNYVTTPLEWPTNAGATGEGYKKLRLIYGQEYVTSTGATGMDSATGGTYYFWNSIIDDADFPSYNQDTYVIGGTATGQVQFLTDGPDSRCALPYDLLYTLIGNEGADEYTWTNHNTCDNQLNFISEGFDTAWLQAANPDYTTGFPDWQWDDGYGVYTEGAAQYAAYGNILYPSPSPDNRYVRLRPGGTVTIRLSSSTTWGNLLAGLWCYGKRDDNGVWEQMGQFTEYNSGGFTYFEYIETIGTGYGYSYIGMATDAGYSSFAYLTSPIVWNYENPGGYLWEVVKNGQITNYEATANSMNYLNVGTVAMGATADYSVKLVNEASGNAFTETITYDQDCNTCTTCDTVQLTWLNSLGGYDSILMNCVAAKSLEASRVISERSLEPGYTKGQRGRMNTYNTAKVVKQVNTNYETQATIDWLESLFMSPDVYEIQSDGSFIPIIIDTTTYSSWVTQDKLKVASFNYSIAYTRKSQGL